MTIRRESRTRTRTHTRSQLTFQAPTMARTWTVAQGRSSAGNGARASGGAGRAGNGGQDGG